ncbi:hypothetical protein LTR02_013030 [Friedmanniomyces endolithicus]|nr:hypothetical protein LTR03_011872 [Friedmanniomyces endolithicus]KAK0893152.1 hypothetical protein LTR02_013030 [Friedmanniomyces endolithicus]
MAKISSSARPASRQGSNAPGAAAPTAPPMTTTRTTRSQSREPEERVTTHRSAGTQKKNAKKMRGLGTVTENGPEEGDLEASALTAEQEAALSAEVVRRESGYSGISGTTAKTTFSQEEIADLDPELIIDVLPDLAKDASKVASLLVDDDTATRPMSLKEVRTTGSLKNKRYTYRLQSLDVHKSKLGSQAYIQPSIVSRALLGVQSISEIPNGPWRPDNILFMINMAEMLRGVVTVASDDEELTQGVYNSLELLDAHFVQCIAGSTTESTPDREAIRLLVKIQTQLVLVRLAEFQKAPHFDPMDVITDSFFNRDVDGELMYKDAGALRLTDENHVQIWDAVTKIARRLKAPFKEGIPIAQAVAELRSKNTWAKFVDEVIGYYVHRSAQLEEEIAAAGGIEQIVESMSKEVQRGEDARLAGMKRQSFASSGPTKGFGKSAIANMKAREKRVSEMSEVALAASAPTGRAPVVPSMNPRMAATEAQSEDDWVPPPVDEVEDQPPAQQRAAATLDMSGFRNMQAQNAKKAKAPTTSRRSSSPRRTPAATSARTSPEKKQRKNPGSAIPPPIPVADPEDGPLPPALLHKYAKTFAKHNRIAASQIKLPQKRIPWTDEEELVLASLIERKGIAWADLKKLDEMEEGNRLDRRDAEAMRVKARLMKSKILQSSLPLPENFELVPLDRKEIIKLHNLGITYEQ